MAGSGLCFPLYLCARSNLRLGLQDGIIRRGRTRIREGGKCINKEMLAFALVLGFIFEGHSGLHVKGEAVWCNGRAGRPVVHGCCCWSLSDKIVRGASISTQPCSVSQCFHMN